MHVNNGTATSILIYIRINKTIVLIHRKLQGSFTFYKSFQHSFFKWQQSYMTQYLSSLDQSVTEIVNIYRLFL